MNQINAAVCRDIISWQNHTIGLGVIGLWAKSLGKHLVWLGR